MMDFLWYQFIRDLVRGSNGLLGYKYKSGAKFGAAREARLEMTSIAQNAIKVQEKSYNLS